MTTTREGQADWRPAPRDVPPGDLGLQEGFGYHRLRGEVSSAANLGILPVKPSTSLAKHCRKTSGKVREKMFGPLATGRSGVPAHARGYGAGQKTLVFFGLCR